MYAPRYDASHIYGSIMQQNLGQSARPYGSGSQQNSSSYHNGLNGAPHSSTRFPSQAAATPAPPTTSTSMSFRYYQPPKLSQVETDSDGESSEEEQSRRAGRGKSSTSASQLRRGACSHCKGLKVKCHFVQGQTSCSRCSLNKLQCVVNGRKKRRAVATHEELILKSHKQDIEIRNLLHQLDEMSTEHRVQTWIAKSRHTGQAQSPRSDPTMLSSQSSSDYARGGARWTSTTSSHDYFAGGSSTSHILDGTFKHEPGIPVLGAKPVMPSFLLSFFSCDVVPTQLSAPDVITRGLIQPGHVRHLFKAYFDLINPYFSILDPVLHTPDRLIWESHFLFTVICTLAAKYVAEYQAIATTLREFVRDAAGKALVQGKKTIDECQAFLLIAVYQAPKKKWEEQRGWLHMGIAFSLAHELKLNEQISLQDFLQTTREPNREIAERQWLNQTRTWLNCYCVDASHATQFGKPAMIAMDDYIARSCTEWYRQSTYNQAFDVHLVSYVEILNRMRRFRIDTDRLETEERENPKKPKKLKDMMDLVMSCYTDLTELDHFWRQRFEKIPDRQHDIMCIYREETNRMNNAFNRLVVLFRGLQKAVSTSSKEGGGLSRDDRIVRLCIDTATQVIVQMTQKLHSTHMLKYSMEAHFLFVTYAAAHLLSLMSPKMSILLQPGDSNRIIDHIRALIDVLQNVAADDRQGSPYLYSRYLTKQLKKFSPAVQSPTAGASYTPQNVRRSDSMLRLDISGAGPSTWTDANSAPYSGVGSVGGSLSSPGSYQEIAGVTDPAGGTSDMPYLSDFNVDFSLNYFVQAVNNPTIMKTTPPPGEPPNQWWQNMFPVSDQGLPGTSEWPMVMGVHAGTGRSHGSNPDAQRAHFHMDLVR